MHVHVGAAAINPKDTLIRKGHFKRFTGSVFPVERIREAHVQQETKHTRGKIGIHMG